jgi:antitoxin ParD1/3/4
MASLNISMPEDMRQFVDHRTREGGFSTPTEYVRSLIREDRRRLEREQFGPLILKWLAEGHLTPDEEASLPTGLLDRVRRRMETQLLEALDSGDAGELNRDRLETILNRARARAAAQAGDSK